MLGRKDPRCILTFVVVVGSAEAMFVVATSGAGVNFVRNVAETTMSA
jgi:hypothetical protein